MKSFESELPVGDVIVETNVSDPLLSPPTLNLYTSNTRFGEVNRQYSPPRATPSPNTPPPPATSSDV
jgi:hypothetical protein